MELLAVVKAVIAVTVIGAGGATFGPNEQPAKADTVAVTNAAGEVLYYNAK